jgi:hypothetical protein
MSIVDGRTLVDNANDPEPAVGAWVDDAGSSMNLAQNTDLFVHGTSSVSDRLSNDIGGIMWDSETTGDLSAGDTIYAFGLATIASGLGLKVDGGIRMRFTGATITNYFEVFIGGSDDYFGGWKMFAVDLDSAQDSPSATGGTPPSIANIATWGIMFEYTVSIPGSADSIFVDAMWRLPASTPGIRIEGENSSVPWTFQDVLDAADITDATKAWGTVERLANGTIQTNTPWRFGADDATADSFSDGAEVIGFDGTQFVPDDFYGFDVIAGAGAQSMLWGSKVGTGKTASGAAGVTITSGGLRWIFTAVDTDQDEVGLFGCTFIGAGEWDITDDAVEVRSCSFSDCEQLEIDSSVTVAKCAFSESPGPKAQVLITTNPADGEFDQNSFSNMSWWGIEYSAAGPATLDLRGVKFSNNGTDRDILLAHASGLITINALEGGDIPGVTNGAVVTVTANNTCNIHMTAMGLSNVAATPVVSVNGNNTTAGANPLAAAVTADDANVYLAAIYGEWDGVSVGAVSWAAGAAYVEQLDENYLPSMTTVSLATHQGVSGAQSASATYSDPTGDIDLAAITVIEVDNSVASPVLEVDPAWRPIDYVRSGTSIVFSYGIPGDESVDELAAIVMIMSNGTGAGDSNINSVSWGGTNMTEEREDLASSPGGPRTTAFSLNGANLHKGTYEVIAGVVSTYQCLDGSDTPPTAIENSEVLIEASDATGDLPFDETVTSLNLSGSTVTAVHTAHGMIDGDLVVIRDAVEKEYNGIHTIANVTINGYEYDIAGSPTSPATGTIKATGAIVSGMTDVSGEISATRSWTLDQPFAGTGRKKTTSPVYKTGNFTGTVSKDTGGTFAAIMQPD